MFRSLLIIALFTAPGFARAELSIGARLAATCVACHGTNGDTKGSTLPPSPASRSKRYRPACTPSKPASANPPS
jgi:cytochrome c553